MFFQVDLNSHLAALLCYSSQLSAQEFTRGVGVYRGDPKEYAGPVIVLDKSSYWNLALRRPAYHSSSYD